MCLSIFFSPCGSRSPDNAVAVLQRTAKKCTNKYNARAQPLFCCLVTFSLPLTYGVLRRVLNTQYDDSHGQHDVCKAFIGINTGDGFQLAIQ